MVKDAKKPETEEKPDSVKLVTMHKAGGKTIKVNPSKESVAAATKGGWSTEEIK